jgi:hypothetical protein
VKLTKKDRQLLKNMADLGVEFEVFGTRVQGGFHTLSVDELSKYLEDPELWREKLGAKQSGVNLQKFRSWFAFISNPQCRGITSKGKQCKRIIHNIPSPDSFNEDIDCYCSRHSRLG